MDPTTSYLLSLSKFGASVGNGNFLSTSAVSSSLNPRLARALLELEEAEALLARTRRTLPKETIPSPWLLQQTAAVVQNAAHWIPSISTAKEVKPTWTDAALVGLNLSKATSTTSSSSSNVGRQVSLGPEDAADAGTSSTKATPDGCPHQPASPSTSSSTLLPTDVLCGRGGRSNHHPGNKRYRQVISQMKSGYRQIGSKAQKTDLSRAIVDHVLGYGGRFVKFDKASGNYQVLSGDEARKKTSQALRESKDVKWTA